MKTRDARKLLCGLALLLGSALPLRAEPPSDTVTLTLTRESHEALGLSIKL